MEEECEGLDEMGKEEGRGVGGSVPAMKRKSVSYFEAH